jgi:trehalose 6-phosphate phosphatase
VKHLFTPAGELALARTMRRRPLLAFDFDGTLAPIVATPADARVPAAVAQRLTVLSRGLPIAIITGRDAADVRHRLAFEPRFIIGNNGAEDAATRLPVNPAVTLADIRGRLCRHATELAQVGVTVETKLFSIALHYRNAADPPVALRRIEQLLAAAGPGVQVFGGKMVVNVVAALAPDKADAVRRLRERCGAKGVLFVGDDVNDDPVFAKAPPHWLTVRVGRDDPASRARFFLDHFDEVEAMLERMVMLLGGAR